MSKRGNDLQRSVVPAMWVLSAVLLMTGLVACAQTPETPITVGENTVPATANSTPVATDTPGAEPSGLPPTVASAETVVAPAPSVTVVAPTPMGVPVATLAGSSPTPTATSTGPAVTPTAVITSSLRAGEELKTLLVGPGEPGRLYALLGNRATDSSAPPMRFLISDDQGATWTAFAGGLPVGPQCVQNINLDYYTADALYASTCQGLYRWSNNQWTLISPQQTGMVAVTYGQPKNIWATSSNPASPIIHSTDGGVTWQNASNGLVYFNGVANLAIAPTDTRATYAIISPKYAGSYLRRSVNGQWTTLPTPMGNAQIDTGMTIDGATGVLYVSAADSRSTPGKIAWQLWRTHNPTADPNSIWWERIHDFGAVAYARVLASGSSSQGLALYVEVAALDGSITVQRSPDSGQSWATMTIH